MTPEMLVDACSKGWQEHNALRWRIDEDVDRYNCQVGKADCGATYQMRFRLLSESRDFIVSTLHLMEDEANGE